MTLPFDKGEERPSRAHHGKGFGNTTYNIQHAAHRGKTDMVSWLIGRP